VLAADALFAVGVCAVVVVGVGHGSQSTTAGEQQRRVLKRKRAGRTGRTAPAKQSITPLDVCRYQRRLSANLIAIVDAVRASGASVALDADASCEQRAAQQAMQDARALGGGGASGPSGAAAAGGVVPPGGVPAQGGAAAGAWEHGVAGGGGYQELQHAAGAPPPNHHQQQHVGMMPPQHLHQPQQHYQQPYHRAQQPLPPALMLLQQQQHPMQLAPPPPQQQPRAAPAWLANVNASVAALLQTVGLSEYDPLFREHRIDLAALELLSREDLKELGLPLGAVVKIQAALRDHQQRRGGAGGGG